MPPESNTTAPVVPPVSTEDKRGCTCNAGFVPVGQNMGMVGGFMIIAASVACPNCGRIKFSIDKIKIVDKTNPISIAHGSIPKMP